MAATCARAFYAEMIMRYGVPKQLHSDRGTQFKSALVAELCATFEVNKTRTTVSQCKGTKIWPVKNLSNNISS